MSASDGGAVMLVAVVGGTLAIFGLALFVSSATEFVREQLAERRKVVTFRPRPRLRDGQLLPDGKPADIVPFERHLKADRNRRLGISAEDPEPPAAG